MREALPNTHTASLHASPSGATQKFSPASRQVFTVPQALYIAAALVATVLIQLAIAKLVRLRHSLITRWRFFKGRRAEITAERLLRRSGYRILARQVERTWTIDVDGETHPVELRADLLVRRGRRRLIAEVKSGRSAPRIETIATRRQLLEYAMAYPVDGVLLVDMQSETIREITFPLPARSARGALGAVASALFVGLALGAGLMWLFGEG